MPGVVDNNGQRGPYRLSLYGRPRLTHPDGRPLPLPDGKSLALLCCLALSPDHRRSRQWLVGLLYPETRPERARANLRQLVNGLRRGLGIDSHILGADRSELWLSEQVEPVLVPEPGHAHTLPLPPEGFLEGIDLGEDAFEGWLRDTRLRLAGEGQRTQGRTRGRRSLAARGGGAVSPRQEIRWQPHRSDGARRSVHVAQRLQDSLIEAVAATGLFTLRVEPLSDTPQAGGIDDEALTVAVSALVYPARDLVRARVEIGLASTRAVIHEEVLDIEARTGSMTTASHTLGARLVGWLVSRLNAGSHPGHAIGRALASLQFPRPFDSARLIEALAGIDADASRGRAVALMAMIKFMGYAERLGVSRRDAVDAATADLSEASALAPDDPIVNVLTAQFAALALGDLDSAMLHSSLASANAPHQPFVLAVRSVCLAYASRPREALRTARQAHRLNRVPAFQGFFDTVLGMASACSGDAATASAHCERSLRDNPHFRSTQLILLASLAHEGRFRPAERIVELMSRRDPDFSVSLVASPEYPLRGVALRDFVIGGLSRLPMLPK